MTNLIISNLKVVENYSWRKEAVGKVNFNGVEHDINIEVYHWDKEDTKYTYKIGKDINYKTIQSLGFVINDLEVRKMIEEVIPKYEAEKKRLEDEAKEECKKKREADWDSHYFHGVLKTVTKAVKERISLLDLEEDNYKVTITEKERYANGGFMYVYIDVNYKGYKKSYIIEWTANKLVLEDKRPYKKLKSSVKLDRIIKALTDSISNWKSVIDYKLKCKNKRKVDSEEITTKTGYNFVIDEKTHYRKNERGFSTGTSYTTHSLIYKQRGSKENYGTSLDITTKTNDNRYQINKIKGTFTAEQIKKIAEIVCEAGEV